MSNFAWVVIFAITMILFTELLMGVYEEDDKKCLAISTEFLLETKYTNECMIKYHDQWLTIPEYNLHKGAE
jgi:hypothetical protein